MNLPAWKKSEPIFRISLVILIAGLFVILVGPPQRGLSGNAIDQKKNLNMLSPQEQVLEQDKWIARIHEVGSAQAYVEFKEAYADVHFGTQHTMSHVVGSEIYVESGIKGIQICDSSFAFGCYHGYFARALSEEGTGIVKLLDEACVAKFGILGTGCQHGIGHGLMEYFGSSLTTALKACEPTTAQSELAGCVSGVFMEYNVPIVISEETGAATIPRELDPNRPYDPCPGLDKKFKPSCYYEISAWWNQITPYKADYKQIGVLCANMSEQAYKETCFLGVGNVIPPSADYDVEASIGNCQLMPDQEAIIACQAGTAWSFDANPLYRDKAKYLCDNLSGEARDRCVYKAHILNPENSNET